MTKILKTDEYMPLYAFAKAANPDQVMMLRAFREKDVEDVDRLVEMSRGNRETVKTDKDWQILNELIVFYIKRWPNEWMEFRASMPEIRQSRRAGGYSKSKEIMHVASLPFRLERLIKVIFPYQQYDKKFMWEFVRRFSAFRVAGVQN